MKKVRRFCNTTSMPRRVLKRVNRQVLKEHRIQVKPKKRWKQSRTLTSGKGTMSRNLSRRTIHPWTKTQREQLRQCLTHKRKTSRSSKFLSMFLNLTKVIKCSRVASNVSKSSSSSLSMGIQSSRKRQDS